MSLNHRSQNRIREKVDKEKRKKYIKVCWFNNKIIINTASTGCVLITDQEFEGWFNEKYKSKSHLFSLHLVKGKWKAKNKIQVMWGCIDIPEIWYW